MDLISKVLLDLRTVLLRKRSSFQGTVGNQATVDNRRKIEQKIDNLTIKIDEVNNAITLRMSEVAAANKGNTHVSTD